MGHSGFVVWERLELSGHGVNLPLSFAQPRISPADVLLPTLPPPLDLWTP